MLNKDFPRYLPYPENVEDLKRYREEATVEAEVTAEIAHFHDGKQWGLQGEIVKLTEGDARVLERAGQVEVISRKQAPQQAKPPQAQK